MASYQDFERDYWAPDPDDVLHRMRPGPQAPQAPDPPQWQAPGAPANTGGTGQNTGYGAGIARHQPAQPTTGAPAGRPFDEGQFARDWQGSGGRTVADLQRFVEQGGYADHGITLGGSKGDKVFQNGRFLADAVEAAGEGGRRAIWLPGEGGGGGGSVPGVGGGPAGGGSAFTDQVRQLLMSQLQGMSQPVNENDPAIAGELQSQARGAERSRQDRRAAAAERAATQGLLQGGASSGAFDAEVNAGFEDKANRLSDVRSHLFGREIQARRQQLGQLMNMALQSGDAEAARAIQMQLAQMDQQFRYANLGEQSRQFNDQFGRQLGRDREEDVRWRSEFGF